MLNKIIFFQDSLIEYNISINMEPDFDYIGTIIDTTVGSAQVILAWTFRVWLSGACMTTNY